MSSRPCALALAGSLFVSTAAPQPQSALAAPLQTGTVRIVGPRGESTPVVNEQNQLQLRVEGAGSVSRWTSDSADVATVSGTGVLSGRRYGFATITAETAAGTARAFVVVVRKTPRRAAKAQGDTKTDTGGNVYLSSPLQHVIYRASASGSGVFAGSPGQADFRNGSGTEARFNAPTGLGVDQSARGGVYVADTENHCVRRIRPDRRAEVVVGLPERSGTMTAERTPISDAVLAGPRGVVVAGGNLMLSDTENHCLWYADLERREVRLMAGEPGVAGSENGRGRAARFNRPSGLAVSTDGRLVAVADTGNDVVRLIAIGAESGDAVYDVTTLGLGSSRRGANVAEAWGEDRGAEAIAFDAPESVSIDAVGSVYVVDETGASVTTRSEDRVERVELAQAGTLGAPASVTLDGTRAFVLDAAAATDDAVNVVEVGPPEIDSVTPGVTGLAGGERVVVVGRNFAPESVVTVGGGVATDYEVVSATRIEITAPPQLAPGVRTVSVRTRGGIGQEALLVEGARLAELARGEITTVAGGIPYVGDGGMATDAGVSVFPASITVDASGAIYVADQGNDRVRRIDPSGAVTTVAGTGEEGFGGDGGPATSATLSSPRGVAVDGAGNLFIADSSNSRVRRVDAVTGIISTVAGPGEFGAPGDGGPATSGWLFSPYGLAFDAAGSLFIADAGNHRVRRVDAASGVITTVAGTGERGYSGDRGPARLARLDTPYGVAVDTKGSVYVADSENHRIRRVNRRGTIATVAGAGRRGFGGDGGPARRAQLATPTTVAVDAAGNLFVADFENDRVRRVDAATKRIATVAGAGPFAPGGDGGPATEARLVLPWGLAFDGAGNLYVSEERGYRVRRVAASDATIATVAGGGEGTFAGDGGAATAARLARPSGVALDAAGNLFIADWYNHRVRRVEAVTGVITTCAGTGERGFSGDNGPATSAQFEFPFDVAVDGDGNLFVVDGANFVIRRVDAASGVITTVAGTRGAGDAGDGGPATEARIAPTGIAVDAHGNLFIADRGNDRVRRVDASTGIITTVAGGGVGGDGGQATDARLVAPERIALDGAGNLFVVESTNFKIRRVDASTGVITTFAGTGVEGYAGDGGPATEAQFNQPQAVAVDGGGNVYVVEFYESRVRRVDAATGIVETVVGTGGADYGGDDGPALLARMYYPRGLAFDGAGNLFIADTDHHAVRAVRALGVPEADAGLGEPMGRHVRPARQSFEPGERLARGQRVIDAVPDCRGENLSVLGSIDLAGRTTALAVDGAVNREVFDLYVCEVLAPTLKPGDIVVWDNLSVHKSATAIAAIEERGAEVLCQPPYSPDLSPIEKM